MTSAAARLASCAVLAACVASLAACLTTDPPRVTAPPSIVRTAAALRVVRAGAERPADAGAVAFVEVAATHAARERGLMGRTSLEADHGMLFVYPAPTPRRYWMKDCLIGLDIAFIRADGTVSALATLPPGAGLADDEVGVASSNGPVQYVLEMETGWFARHGVAVGSTIDVSAAAEGVRAE